MSNLVASVAPWPTNADLVADVARLGYIGDQVLDATYGEGKWWTRWQPAHLVRSDAAKATGDLVADARRLPFPDWTFDTVCNDMPYRLSGRRDQGDFDDRFGLGTYTGPAAVQALINDGITEAARIVKPGGTALVKLQAQVAGGRFHWQDIEAVNHAATVNLALVDRFDRLYTPRPQPGRRQVHSRGRPSTLLVFRKTRRRNPPKGDTMATTPTPTPTATRLPVSEGLGYSVFRLDAPFCGHDVVAAIWIDSDTSNRSMVGIFPADEETGEADTWNELAVFRWADSPTDALRRAGYTVVLANEPGVIPPLPPRRH